MRSQLNPWEKACFALLFAALLGGGIVANDCCRAGFGQTTPTLPQANNAQSQALLQLHTPVGAQQNVTNNHQGYSLKDEDGKPVKPMAVVRVDDDLYFLGPTCLWFCLGAKTVVGAEDILVLKCIDPPLLPGIGVPWQEFNDFIYLPERKAFVILDKSGDLFEYLPNELRWGVYLRNVPTTGPPDPDYIALAREGSAVLLLDPERNQIWRLPQPKAKLQTFFREVLAWRLKHGDQNVTDGIAIGFNQSSYVLRRGGRITKYDGGPPGHAVERAAVFHYPAGLRPSRMAMAGEHSLYMVERENNRVTKFDTVNGSAQCFSFPPDTDLRGLVPSLDGFWVLSGTRILYRSDKDALPPPGKISPRHLEARLKGFTIPIRGQHLPGHPGVFPGARRLYRYGVHEGLDMFGVPMNTPVIAAKSGRIIRADTDFADMDLATFNRIMAECRRQHYTSAKNEDLFRGCQVWIDHGNGIVTRYAHLNSVKPDLKVNAMIGRGDLIGYVGVSGTGQNLPGRIRYPHLHFEIQVDGKYLGWGLTPGETIGVYEDVFNSTRK